MGVIVEDLRSTNGTVVNGHRVTSPMKLSAGDTITLGDSELKVVEA
jgi:pSer/pThr/pTyr-binding forkhead associated (FHA) protein